MGKGSNTSTNATSSSADPQAAQAYRDLLTRAQGVAATPYQAYSGELTAPVNSQQNLGISGINANAGFASPFIQQASSQAASASSPLTGGQIQSYLNPYTQSVVDATTAQMMHDNQQQNAQLTGNQISQGALGGNATGVARGILAGQQNRTLASTTADLYSKGYGQALQTAQAQQQLGLAGANAQANYGISGQNALLAGAGQQINAGSLQQQNEQARLDAMYKQYVQAQAFPYQQTQWLAGVDTGVGSNLGGVSSGSTTGPAPNQTAQWLGLGLTGAGLLLGGPAGGAAGAAAGKLFAANGGRINAYANGGGVAGPFMQMAGGGVPAQPWSDGLGWIPQMAIHAGPGAPHASAPSLQNNQQPSFDVAKMTKGLEGVSSGLKSRFGGSDVATDTGIGDGAWYGANSVGGAPLGGFEKPAFTGLGIYARGGGVAGYAGGGAPNRYVNGIPFADSQDEAQGMFGEGEDVSPAMSFEDRAAPVRQAIAAGDFDPSGINSTDFRGSPAMEASNRGVAPTPMARPEGAGASVVASDDEEAAGVAARPRGPAGPPVMAFAPGGGGSYGDIPDAISRPREGGLISANASTGLLAAGLGMMASRSPFLGNAVGEGGLAGVAAYGAANEADRKTATEAAKLSQEARKQYIADALGNRKQTETERHNKATENKEAASRIPAGYRFNKKGDLEAIPGGPADEGVVERLTKARGKNRGVNEEDAEAVANYYVETGDTSRLNALGVTSEARQRVQHFIKAKMAKDNVTDAEMGTRTAEWAGRKAAQRTLATQEAKMGSAAFEAEGAIKLARGVIEKLPRTSFLPFNQLLQGYSKKTLNPDQAELYARAQAIVNTYSAVMARGANITTDSSRAHASELLNTAFDPPTFNRIMNTMLNEIELAKHSPARMREFYRQQYGPKALAKEDGTTAPAGGAAVTPPAGGLVEGRTGTKGGRPVVVKGGRLIYSDTGEDAQ